MINYLPLLIVLFPLMKIKDTMKRTMLYVHIIFICYLSYVNASNNIVLIVADDLDLVLDGMTPLNKTVNLIGKEGATYTNCFVASPICCPNRASILTGRYLHNHLTRMNTPDGNCSSAFWQETQEPNTFAALINKYFGYKTFYAGKYMNQYGRSNPGGLSHIPPGWDSWNALVGNSVYYDYSLSLNGKEKKFGHTESDYLTDVIARYATNFIKKQTKSQPFLMYLAPPAPHAPYQPAVRHVDFFKGRKAKRTPNFNTLPQQDKHWLVRQGPAPLPDNVLPELDMAYQRRWETLLAVDELVERVVTTLAQQSLLNNTYIIFTSDNGYHLGQFSLPVDKRQPYETDIRVPFLIRGPQIRSGIIRKEPISAVDLFATILGIAGMQYPSDGKSILSSTLSMDRTLLIEYKGQGQTSSDTNECPISRDRNVALCQKNFACKCEDALNNTYSCVRRISKDFNNIFCLFEEDEVCRFHTYAVTCRSYGYLEFVEAYDLNRDSYEMTNIGPTMKRGLRYRFRKRLKKMVQCKGVNCIFNGPKNNDLNYKRYLRKVKVGKMLP